MWAWRNKLSRLLFIFIGDGNECQNICDNVVSHRDMLGSLEKEEAKSKGQLSINMKTPGAAPEEYLSRVTLEPIRQLPEKAVIQCEGNIYIIKFESGVTYHGEIVNNERNGCGTQTWPDKAIYVGDWKSNEPNGRGKFTHPSGDFYEGDWQFSKAHGQGKFVKKNGDTYTGGWESDEPAGEGS